MSEDNSVERDLFDLQMICNNNFEQYKQHKSNKFIKRPIFNKGLEDKLSKTIDHSREQTSATLNRTLN